jgi:hypothetical protein
MYSTCLFCQGSLGKNEVIEAFPIGRRLAFDSDKGRLWVVCRKCARWNLTPLEERWEAIEECERAFSGTRLRVSTDHVGLARVSEGLELIRIGQPQRPEFAAWRYGDQFSRRRRTYLLYTVPLLAGGAAKFIAGPVLGMAALGTGIGAIQAAAIAVHLYQQNRVRARVAIPGEKRPAIVRANQIKKIRIVSADGVWRIRMPIDGATLSGTNHGREVTVEGEPALRAAATILSVANEAGADQKTVQTAVKLVTDLPDASQLFVNATSRAWRIDPQRNKWVLDEVKRKRAKETRLTNIPYEVRLALEMAANEGIERRAMEGELAMLEEAWKQAEEIAGIADNLDLAKPADDPARS